MFRNTPVFSTFSVNDLDAAKKFYSGVMGFGVSQNHMGLLQVSAGDGTGFVIYPKPDHRPADFTVLNLQVDDMDASVTYLTDQGVVFTQYHNDYIQTDERGVSTDARSGMKIAWFTDPAGNILSLIEGGPSH
jgi:predicted enzyme related to lactoylglutathione lyase